MSALITTSLLQPLPAAGQTPTFNRHPLVLDGQGLLLSWVQPQDRAYGTVTTLAWNALAKSFPTQSNGLKPYLSYSTFSPTTLNGLDWPHNPASLYAMLADSALLSYPYSGQGAILDLAQAALDYMLDHGLTSSGWQWPGVPFASSDPGATTYGGSDDMRWCAGTPCGRGDGAGVIEPDKVGELGYAYLRFYEITGNARYRDEAVACANVLARHVRAGDASRSPWPFRVNAQTGSVREEYSAHVLGPIMLLDALIRLGLGDVAAYRAPRQTAWDWLLAYPMRTNAWSGYFEDVPIMSDPSTNPNEYVPLQTARYVLEHPELDPDWRIHARQLIAYVQDTFAVDVGSEPGLQWGAYAISEQAVDMAKMGSHTAHFAALNALWYVATGDTVAKEKAFRSFNWATYMTDTAGIVSVGVDGNEGWWFSDGYGDYLRHFMLGLGAVPEWAPAHESHLLRSSALVRRVAYATDSIDYSATAADATEVLRLTAAPVEVRVGGVPISRRDDLAAEGFTVQPLASGDVVVRVRHVRSDTVRIALTPSPTPTPPPSASAPPSAPPTPPGGAGSPPGPLPAVPPSSFHARWLDQSAYPVLRPGDAGEVVTRFANTGDVSWNRGIAGREVRLGVQGDDRSFANAGMGVNWPLADRVALQDEAVVVPGGIATFRFSVRAPSRPGVYQIPLRPVADGITWLEDNGVFILVTSDWGFHSRWAGQSSYPVLRPGEVSGDLFVTFGNEGSRAWRRGTGDQVNLGVVGDATLFADLGMSVEWLSPNRVGTTREDILAPGNSGTFTFRVRAPSAPGTYVINLRPVVDGVTWLEDNGVWLRVTVLQ